MTSLAKQYNVDTRGEKRDHLQNGRTRANHSLSDIGDGSKNTPRPLSYIQSGEYIVAVPLRPVSFWAVRWHLVSLTPLSQSSFGSEGRKKVGGRSSKLKTFQRIPTMGSDQQCYFYSTGLWDWGTCRDASCPVQMCK